MKIKILEEFKQFAMRGNVVDMAVGIIIGGAFGKIVSSLVADIIMPPIGLLIGGVNFTELKIPLKAAVFSEAGKEKGRSQNARGAEIAHAVREHERRAVDRSGIRRVLPAVQHDLGVGRYDIPAGAGAQQRVGTLFGFIERQRVERDAENVCLHTSENTLPIFSRMRRSADSS